MIRYNDDFTTSGFSGTGSKTDPYRLAWKTIETTANEMINIQNTTAHFVIENNLLNGSDITYDGIWIRNVSNAIIRNNIICNQLSNSIFLTDTENSTISANKISNQTYVGIGLERTSNITVLGNTIHNCTDIASGIYTLNSRNNNYTGNTVDEFYTGIFLNDNTNLTSISSNVVFNNFYHGIGVFSSHNSTISHNVVFNNRMYGTKISQGALSLAENNTVIMNDYSQNNLPGTGIQVFDDGSFNNIINHNYYFDWTGSGFYNVEGSALNKDLSPAINPHHLTAPSITYPTNELQVLSEDVTVNWTASTDIVGHTITYTILYSTNSGTSWINLVSGLNSPKYSGDLSTISDGVIHIKIRATDSVGFHSFSKTKNFTLYSIPYPTVSIDSPTSQTYTTNTITVTLSGNSDQFWYNIESVDSQNQSWTTSIDRTLEDGAYVIHAYGNNSFGRITHVQLAFTIDTITIPDGTVTPGWTIPSLVFAIICVVYLKRRKMV
jgi:parallel beta-helix repeat protein